MEKTSVLISKSGSEPSRLTPCTSESTGPCEACVHFLGFFVLGGLVLGVLLGLQARSSFLQRKDIKQTKVPFLLSEALSEVLETASRLLSGGCSWVTDQVQRPPYSNLRVCQAVRRHAAEAPAPLRWSRPTFSKTLLKYQLWFCGSVELLELSSSWAMNTVS